MAATVLPTRERLLDAARSLVEEDGYAAASVLAIAGRAGVASGTLYRHFDSKEELFVELFRAACDRELEAMAQAAQAARAAPAADVLVEILETFARRALRSPRLAYALLVEPVAPLVDAERLAYRRRYAALVMGVLSEGVASGQLPDQDPALTAAALVGALSEVLVGPLSKRTGEARPADDWLLLRLSELILRAIGAATA